MLKLLIPILVLICSAFGEDASTLCGDATWTLYRDLKCIKYIDQLTTYEGALEVCRRVIGTNDSSPLITIKSAEEQAFVTKLLFQDHQVIENVWLGAERGRENSLDFQWSDGSELDYTNWAPENPTDELEKNCTELTSHLSRQVDDGLWKNTPCARRNLVLCQKVQDWDLLDLQHILLQLRQEFDEAKKNPVPIGFTFVQLPSQEEPSLLWPSVTWTEVTSNYSGLFFRAEGGGSAAFGTTQEENSPRFTKIEHADANETAVGAPKFENPLSLAYNGNLTGYIRTGHHTTMTGDSEALRFLTVGGEVRPRNTAVRTSFSCC